LKDAEMKIKFDPTKRCEDVLKKTKQFKLITPKLLIRDWIDLSDANEFRCFVFERKLKAISSNDVKICEFENAEIRDRCLDLFERVLEDDGLPVDNCVMDVALMKKEKDDVVIEFNSWGSWGNSGSGCFDWNQDKDILESNINREIQIRLSPLNMSFKFDF
jgi:hypothetical protein